jgi:alginate O-acetyltransferase complex protein AlgI
MAKILIQVTREMIFAIGAIALFALARFPLSPRARQVLYLAASYLFYCWIGRAAVVWLLASTLFNFTYGLYLRRSPTARRLWGGIVVNLLLLFFFKYLPAVFVGHTSASPEFAAIARIALPVGMSFWTFQALSYLFDLYREEELDPSLTEFALYMTFAPTVLSGPICRLGELLPQFREAGRAAWSDVRGGAQRVWLGLFMTAIARLLGAGLRPGTGVDSAFAAPHLAGLDVWVVTIAYGFQLYFDFAGYSNIAIGAARMFGFRIRENFNSPYLSTTPSEFWTRWHKSLSFWIRDYVFLPLATRRRDLWWRLSCLVLAMVLFGLWHRATWAFVLWGAYHGILQVIHRLSQNFIQSRDWDEKADALSPVWRVATFLSVCFGWIFFRASSADQALGMMRAAFQRGHASAVDHSFLLFVAVVVACYFLIEALGARGQRSDDSPFAWIPVELRFVSYAAIAYVVLLRPAQAAGFVYFQF